MNNIILFFIILFVYNVGKVAVGVEFGSFDTKYSVGYLFGVVVAALIFVFGD